MLLIKNRKSVDAQYYLRTCHTFWKSTDKWSLTCFKSIWKFPIPTIYNFAAIYSWNLLFSYKVAYFLTVSIVFSVYKQNFKLINLKTKTATNTKISVFAICVEAIIYLLLYTLHDCTFDFMIRSNCPECNN